MNEEYVVLYKLSSSTSIWNVLEIDGSSFVGHNVADQSYIRLTEDGFPAKVARIVAQNKDYGIGSSGGD